MSPDNLKLLYSEEEIREKVKSLAGQISRDYARSEPILVAPLKGAFIFLADLVRNLTIPVRIDFVRVTSYGSQSFSSGEVKLIKDLEFSPKDQDVIIVEDIVDTGTTLNFLFQRIKEQNPRSLKICALLDKKSRRKVEIQADYLGFDIEDYFVVGYGLDFDERYRYLPQIYKIES